MNRLAYSLIAALAIALLGIAAYVWLQDRETPVPADVPPAPQPVPQAIAPAPAAEPPASAVRHPIEPAATAEAAPPTVEQALTDLFGRKAVLSLFQLDDFPRRLVATVDNLARSHAPASVWPVNPADGRFSTTETPDGRTVIDADNAARYTPYVLLLETVDLRRAVDAYRALYPQLQSAYQELGYPTGYFNDRLVQVIDHLLATPEPEGPLEVIPPQVKGPVPLARPWVLYEFADPALQSLSAGQKLLLRMGPVNARRVKEKLQEIRRLVTTPGPGR